MRGILNKMRTGEIILANLKESILIQKSVNCFQGAIFFADKLFCLCSNKNSKEYLESAYELGFLSSTMLLFK